MNKSSKKAKCTTQETVSASNPEKEALTIAELEDYINSLEAMLKPITPEQKDTQP